MMNAYETLMAEAEVLGKQLNTDWAYENADRYYSLEEKIVKAYYNSELTSEQANEICSTAFYDYDSDVFED